MRLTVIYYSKTGHTKDMAEHIVKGMCSVEGCEARAFATDCIDRDFVADSSAVVVGAPVYAGTACTAIQSWLESEAGSLGLAGKLGGAFTTAAYVHGGGDLGLLTILQHMMFRGMMTYSGGASCGSPVIHLGPEAINADHDSYGELFEVFGKRFAEQTVKVFG